MLIGVKCFTIAGVLLILALCVCVCVCVCRVPTLVAASFVSVLKVRYLYNFKGGRTS